MGVLLHANYRLRGPNGQKIVMPAPIDKDTPHAPWWWDVGADGKTLKRQHASQAAKLAAADEVEWKIEPRPLGFGTVFDSCR